MSLRAALASGNDGSTAVGLLRGGTEQRLLDALHLGGKLRPAARERTILAVRGFRARLRTTNRKRNSRGRSRSSLPCQFSQGLLALLLGESCRDDAAPLM